MTKHLRFLIVLLLTLVWSTGWAQTTIDFTKVTWNGGYTEKPYTFKADKSNGSASPTQHTTAKDIRLYAKNKLTVSTTGKKIVKIVFTISAAGKKQWAELTATTGSVVADKDNSIATWENVEGATSVTFTVGDKCKYGTAAKTKVGQFYFNSVDIYELSAEPGKTPTSLSFPKASFSFATTDDLSSFTGQTATLSSEGTTLTGKSITYSKFGDNIFSSFDTANGTFVLNGNAGTATVTATFAGDDTYASASAEYTLNVVDPNKTDVTFDFTDPSNFGYTESSSVKIVLNEGDKLTKDGFVLENVQAGKYTTRLHDGYLKIFASDKNHPAKGKISLSAPAGCVINRIVFTDNSGSPVSNLTFSIGEIDSNSKTWTGSAKTLTMEVAQTQVFIQTMTIYFVKDTETITFNETATNTIEAKTGVNVTLNRPMNVGRWNTFCVPFSIDAKQIASQFGEGTQIAKFVDSIDDEIKFTTLTSNEIVAGEPYLVKPINAADSYSFTNVSVAATDPITKGGGEYISFKGIYNPTDITVGLPDNTFAAGIVGNVVKKAVSDSKMKGFRAFFIIPEGAGAQSSYMLKIDGTATSINSINGADVVVNAPVYNLQGQRVDGNNLTPGIYVKAGKKFVVK